MSSGPVGRQGGGGRTVDAALVDLRAHMASENRRAELLVHHDLDGVDMVAEQAVEDRWEGTNLRWCQWREEKWWGGCFKADLLLDDWLLGRALAFALSKLSLL